MRYDYDVAVIGTGTSAYHVVNACTAADLKVAVIDSRGYGGTCAIRGCQPKKYLIAAADVVERSAKMQPIGLKNMPKIDWPALMRSKNTFTDPVPQRTEAGFRDAGAETLHGQAKFKGPNFLQINDLELTTRNIVIATGAVPRPLGINGEAHLTSSEDFLSLQQLPLKIVFVGGGFISFEFAHVARMAGSKVTILQRGPRVLKQFDPDLTAKLVDASREMGIRIETGSCVDSIEKNGSKLTVRCEENPDIGYEADMVVHGAGRVPALKELDLDKGEVSFSQMGVEVNSHLQSTSNPAVYAIGDAADTPYQLATTGDLEGQTAAENIISGNSLTADYSVVPSSVFTLPPLSSVGISEAAARDQFKTIKINSGNTTGWPSSRRIGQTHGAYKVIIDAETRHILGAHLLGHNADEAINIFALAIKFGLTADQVKNTIWSYPTYISDLKYMLG
jgi:glutathione reductase (NADPH)